MNIKALYGIYKTGIYKENEDVYCSISNEDYNKLADENKTKFKLVISDVSKKQANAIIKELELAQIKSTIQEIDTLN